MSEARLRFPAAAVAECCLLTGPARESKGAAAVLPVIVQQYAALCREKNFENSHSATLRTRDRIGTHAAALCVCVCSLENNKLSQPYISHMQNDGDCE